ncbi:MULTISPECIES: GlxA family transcriptional regulator [Microbulbifer]|uniref:GlxA family transcriptional regulator n=1 Tax=Microbulbifer celer TaxID=435905 RepID=A0ABW3U9I5_9GAMM|nr:MULTISPECIES: GlxA family transcriptional regulator [Microbulbifer]UFN58235.1 GlxA family transcriptional regulator [Microbulbifer celer]
MTTDSPTFDSLDTFQPPKFGPSDVVHIGFVLIPQFSFFALACCSEPLRVANRLADRKLFQFTFMSEDGAPVEASNGIPFEVQYPMAECPSEYQTVVVVSGFNPLQGCSDTLYSELRRLSANGVSLGCVDTGAHILAKAGLLQGQKAIVHWEASSGFQESYPSVQVVPERFLIEENQVSAAGGLSSLDMMLNIIRAAHGSKLATAVAEQFTYTHVQSADDAQRMSLRGRLSTTNRRLIQAVQIMEQNLATPLSIKQIASQCETSVRELERLFKNEVGTPPKRYYRRLRLDKARQLLRQTEMTVLDIAISCGFQSAAYFSSAYRQDFGVSPSKDRGYSPG